MEHDDRIALLVADIEDELGKLERLRQEYAELQRRVDLAAAEASAYDKAVVGYYLHNFYNGCESIFRSIARFFENDLAAGSWHSDLLKRMKQEVAGYRPRVIDDTLYVVLDDFRAFRHKFRHCYTFELDWPKERLVAEKFDSAHALVLDQVRRFLARLREFAASEEP